MKRIPKDEPLRLGLLIVTPVPGVLFEFRTVGDEVPLVQIFPGIPGTDESIEGDVGGNHNHRVVKRVDIRRGPNGEC